MSAIEVPAEVDALENTSEQREQTTEEHVLLIENQSHVLDEVDQLVELMTAEKNTLTEKISTLETELSKAVSDKSSLEEANHQLQCDYDTANQQLQQLEDKHSQECSDLREALKKTRKELKQTRNKLESLTSSFSHKAEKFTKLCGQNAELKQKLKQLTEEYRNAHTALELQCRENIKLSECYKRFKSENAVLSSRLEGAQQRCRHSQDEVLALKGRLTMSKKTQEQLQGKNSALEKALESASSQSPTVVKVSTRSREELRLAADCRRKDELLARYAEEFSQSQNEKHMLQQNIQKLKKALHTESEEKTSLCAALEKNKHESKTVQETLQEELQHCGDKIVAQTKEVSKFSTTKQELERQLCDFEGELSEARTELDGLRREVEERERRSDKEVNRLEKEREQSMELIKSSREMIEKLSKELELTRTQHSEQVEQLNSQWEGRLKEAWEDYRRMKEASTKRCTELAKEVWTLKSRLRRDSTEPHPCSETTN